MWKATQRRLVVCSFVGFRLMSWSQDFWKVVIQSLGFLWLLCFNLKRCRNKSEEIWDCLRLVPNANSEGRIILNHEKGTSWCHLIKFWSPWNAKIQELFKWSLPPPPCLGKIHLHLVLCHLSLVLCRNAWQFHMSQMSCKHCLESSFRMSRI